jgi:hypothetical protein
MDLFALIIGFAGGGAVVWMFKDTLLGWYNGTAATIASLEAKAAALKAKL